MLTPRHIRAGRAALGWSQAMLARESGLSESTIKKIELGGDVMVSNATRVKVAMERNGITFRQEDDNGTVAWSR